MKDDNLKEPKLVKIENQMSQFPNDATGDALNAFKKNGFDLTKPMEIDFFIAIPSEEIGEKISTEVKRLGCKASVEQDEITKEWTCYCTNTMIPFYDDIIKFEEDLNNIASQYGGYTDGFGSFGNV
ncbi:ribonuclease E inhibitor RraB [Acinetobacter seifertii]|nr:ribonuclease E inhibitor RraB [Acinetobacter seifertii]MDB0280093.1 hypothetical protein [Acinetobacter seifertii]